MIAWLSSPPTERIPQRGAAAADWWLAGSVAVIAPLAVLAGRLVVLPPTSRRRTGGPPSASPPLPGPAGADKAITIWVNDDAAATVGTAVLMSLVGLALALLGLAVYRPLLRSRPAAADAIAGDG